MACFPRKGSELISNLTRIWVSYPLRSIQNQPLETHTLSNQINLNLLKTKSISFKNSVWFDSLSFSNTRTWFESSSKNAIITRIDSIWTTNTWMLLDTQIFQFLDYSIWLHSAKSCIDPGLATMLQWINNQNHSQKLSPQAQNNDVPSIANVYDMTN